MNKSLFELVTLEKLIFSKQLDSENAIGQLIHVFGKAGSGKTTLALQLAIKICSKGRKVIYIDTEGKVTGGKIKDISPKEIFPLVNKNLKLYVPQNFDTQHQFIEQLDYYLKNQKIGMLIIDTITNHYRQEILFRKDNKELYEKLAYEVALFRKIAKEKVIPILMMNQSTMRKNIEENNNLGRELVNPVAKAIMSYWSDREIILISHGWGDFEARKPGEHEGRVKFSISTNGITLKQQ